MLFLGHLDSEGFVSMVRLQGRQENVFYHRTPGAALHRATVKPPEDRLRNTWRRTWNGRLKEQETTHPISGGEILYFCKLKSLSSDCPLITSAGATSKSHPDYRTAESCRLTALALCQKQSFAQGGSFLQVHVGVPSNKLTSQASKRKELSPRLQRS